MVFYAQNANSVYQKSRLAIILLCLLSLCSYAQPDWKLKRNEDGIKVFTASTEHSDFKSVKVECVINARLSQLVAYLLDINQLHNWVYGTKHAELVKKIAPNELTFYSEISVPWPCNNRDYVAHIIVNQASPQHVTIDSHGEPNLVPEKDGKVRVKHSVAHWEVTAQLSKDQLYRWYIRLSSTRQARYHRGL